MKLQTTLITLAVTTSLALPLTGQARAEDYPPAFTYKHWLQATTFMEGKVVGLPSPTAGSDAFTYILWSKDALQLRYTVYKGTTADPANIVADTGEFTPDEPQHGAFFTENNQYMGEAKVSRVNETYWKLDRVKWITGKCKKTGAGIECPQIAPGGQEGELGPGDYTAVMYWRDKAGEPWRLMHVAHAKLETLGGGSGRFKQEGWNHVASTYSQMAALNLSPKDGKVYAEWYDGGGPEGKEPNWGKCKRFVGLFKGDKNLVALGTASHSDSSCWFRYNHYKEKKSGFAAFGGESTRLQRPGPRGGFAREDFAAADLLGEDGKYTLVVVTGDWRRTWDFEVKGGAIVPHERQRDGFRPAWYAWVEFNEDPKMGRQWLPSKADAAQPLNVK